MLRDPSKCRLALGDQIPYFSLAGTDGRIYSRSDFEGAKALVILFTCNYCPYVQAYDQRIVELARHFRPQNISFVGICSNDPVAYPADSFDQMVEKSRSLGLPYPYLFDDTQIVAKSFDAAVTPECYVFDHDLRLRYHGRVDDSADDLEKIGRNDLEDAIEALSAQRLPQVALTPVLGCPIKWKL